jgi:uncharacterized protein
LRFRNKQLLGWLVILALVFAYAARIYAHHYTLAPGPAIFIYCSFILLLSLVLAPGFGLRLTFAERRRSVVLIPLWCLPYLLYAIGTNDFRWRGLCILLAIAAGTWSVYAFFVVRNLSFFSWQDATVAILLLFAALSGYLKGIWSVPANLDFMSRLFLVAVASWCWVYIRCVPGLGYEFRFSPKILGQAALNFVFFAAIAIPLSLALHFTKWNPRWRGPIPFFLDYLEIFLFVALLEETFFRGFLQNLFSRTLDNWFTGQLIVSCLFGLFHILHAPFPNWRYVALATLAGWFYGSAFRNGGNLMASCLVHAAVDTTWRTWFSAR